MPFTIARGTNISHWLSQSDRRGEERAAWFTAADVRRLAEYGLDHFRLPVDEEQMWTAQGAPEPAAFALMDTALDWAAQTGLKVIVDLHTLRSHSFTATEEPALYRDPQEATRFAGLWRQLATHLRRRPHEQVACELLNEPIADTAAPWNRVAQAAFAAVREADPERVIVLGSNRWQSPQTFPELWLPEDPHCILSFHFYTPMFVTHYRAPWWTFGYAYAGPVNYPGAPIPAAELAKLPADFQARIAAERANQPWDREATRRALTPVLAARDRSGHPLYCGEFGSLHTVPLEVRQRWYRDIVGVLRDCAIPWANWDYKGGFGLIESATGRDTGIAAALLGE